MKIAIDALGIGNIGGGRSAAYNLLEPLLSFDKQNEYLLFLDYPEPALQQPNVRQIYAPVHNRFMSRLWAQAAWPGLLRREHVDLIHYTKNLVTLHNPCPSIATIHDLTMLTNPEIFPAADVLYYRTLGKYVLRHTDHLIAVSHTTAADIRRFYGIADERITIIHEGIAADFQPASQADVDAVRKEQYIPEHYLLHVGSIWPKKNLATLVKTYQELYTSGRYQGALVLAGRPYRGMQDPLLEKAVAECQVGQVIRTGAIPQAQLPALLSGADCFVFPSLHEGFGLAPLEAMACGAPVVAARSDAIDEVLGDAALLVDDPRDIEAFARLISQVVSDPAFRAQMVESGLRRAALYSRQRAALKTLDLYTRLAANPKGVAG